MVVINAKAFNPNVWVPPSSDGVYKIEVVRSDGTVDDVTDTVINCDFVLGVTENLDSFTFRVSNVRGTLSGIWSEMDQVFLYYDYSTTASTKRFSGVIERVNYANNLIIVNGRGDSRFFTDVTITGSFSNELISDVLLSIIALKNDGSFSVTGVLPTTSSITIEWVQVPFWTAVVALCKAANFDVYIDANKVWNFFSRGSVLNNNDAVVLDYNILSMDDFSNDVSQVKNEVQVYGAVASDGLQLFHTSRDSVSQTRYGVRELKLTDTSIFTYEGLVDQADYLLEENKNPPVTGSIECAFLAGLSPGDSLLVSAPENNLPASRYVIDSFVFSIKEGFPSTVVSINKRPTVVSDVIKLNIQNVNSQKDSINPNNLDFTYGVAFDLPSGTLVNAVINDGALRTNGGASGSWVSNVRVLPVFASSVQVYFAGSELGGVVVSVSGNGGANYEVFGNGEFKGLGAAVGSSLLIKVEFSSSSARVSSVNVLYK